MHISLDGFVAGPNGEMDWIKVDEEIFDRRQVQSVFVRLVRTYGRILGRSQADSVLQLGRTNHVNDGDG